MQDEIIFDDLSKIRIIQPDSFDKSEKLVDQSKDFITKISDFTSIVHYFDSLILEHAKQIEGLKQKTIGQRMKIASEMDNRQVQINRMGFHVAQKQAEVERCEVLIRLMVYADSLEKVVREQTLFIEQLEYK